MSFTASQVGHGRHHCCDSVIDEDYQGEIKLLMHNTTETNYKVLKEDPVVQMVVYRMDKLPTIHTDGDCVPSRINLQVKRGDKGFGEATMFFQPNYPMTCQTLKYHAVVFGHMSYGKLQPNIKKIIEAVTLYSPLCLLLLSYQTLLHQHHGRKRNLK